MVLLNRVGRGNNASVWRARFPKRRKVGIVKRISLRRTAVYARFAWRAAGLASPLHRVSGEDEAFVRGIAGSCYDLEASEETCVVPLDCVYAPTKADGAQKLLRGNEYCTEVAVGVCLTRRVNAALPAPTFCRIQAAWRSAAFGNILMEHAGKSLESCLDSLTLAQLQSVVLQVLVALAWAQKRAHFKHHDLHPGNVFIKRSEVPAAWHTPSGTCVHLPDTSLRAVIADFGLSAATDSRSAIRHCRADYALMSTEGRAWGAWTERLEGDEGYDIMVLISALREDATVPAQSAWVRSLEKAARELAPALRMSNRGRPLTRVGFAPEQLLRHAACTVLCEAPPLA